MQSYKVGTQREGSLSISLSTMKINFHLPTLMEYFFVIPIFANDLEKLARKI